MIVVKLQGGLGNQMFQYAAGRSLVNNDEGIFLDHGFFELGKSTEQFTARKYELDIFKNLEACKATRAQVKLFCGNSVLNKMVRRFLKPVYIRQHENELVSLQGIPRGGRVYLDGYFQSEKYFSHIRSQLLEEFAFPALDSVNENIYKKIKEAGCSVSMHVRRGDYLKPVFKEIHGLLPMEYYHAALDELEKENAGISLFVFSDDVEWMSRNFKRDNMAISFVDHNQASDSWKDMVLMSACKHHIIANSSFSWWGAWLSEEEGTTFAPCNWFNPLKTSFNIHDFIPAHWRVIT